MHTGKKIGFTISLSLNMVALSFARLDWNLHFSLSISLKENSGCYRFIVFTQIYICRCF